MKSSISDRNYLFVNLGFILTSLLALDFFKNEKDSFAFFFF